tara:strand:- start:290 stop:859 length:570 start_codon:yes stop_codon:yes gene_type:complete
MALIWAAARLFRRQGYAGTGLADILAASGAPRGSLYHYFPGGKEEIGAAAVAAAGGLVSDTLRELVAAAASPADFIRDYTDLLTRWLAASGFRDGCPITTTLLEMAPESEPITSAGRAAFADWRGIVADLLRRHGWPDAEAMATALAIIGGLEGSLLLARVDGNPRALEAATDALCRLVAAPPQAKSQP